MVPFKPKAYFKCCFYSKHFINLQAVRGVFCSEDWAVPSVSLYLGRLTIVVALAHQQMN